MRHVRKLSTFSFYRNHRRGMGVQRLRTRVYCQSSDVFAVVFVVFILVSEHSKCLRQLPIAPTVNCRVIYSQFGLAIQQNDHQARRRFVEWAQNEIAVVPDFHKRILLSDEAHFWLNGYVNKQNYRICSEANPQVYVETPLHPEKLTVWCALWAGGILLQKR
ncbi:transposable element Tc3 transposase [Trichonephila clavipes]|uniref:Transposable element Tc3 transposase n=1 Tax=Trichonephila clavipes TaxID=2585209 RepID=A0A8X6SAG3_TRICX|nr:transposable element Tc3 transposase [Trichonephila clavipes]